MFLSVKYSYVVLQPISRTLFILLHLSRLLMSTNKVWGQSPQAHQLCNIGSWFMKPLEAPINKWCSLTYLHLTVLKNSTDGHNSHVVATTSQSLGHITNWVTHGHCWQSLPQSFSSFCVQMTLFFQGHSQEDLWGTRAYCADSAQ